MEKINQRQLQKDLYNSNWQDYQHLDWDEAFHKGIEIGIEFANPELEKELTHTKELLEASNKRIEVLEGILSGLYNEISPKDYPKHSGMTIVWLDKAKLALQANSIK